MAQETSMATLIRTLATASASFGPKAGQVAEGDELQGRIIARST